MADFPNRINELRRARGMSQEALAERLNTTKITISRLEREKMELTLNWMRRIALELGCSPADLLLERDNPDRVSEEDRRVLDALRSGDEGTRSVLRRVAASVTEFRHEPQEPDRKAG